MPTVLSVLTAATPAPSPENTLRPGLDPSQVSPGLIGFLMTFVLTAAGMLNKQGFNILALDMRDHGDSTIEDGRHAAGTEEYQDVLGGFDWLAPGMPFPNPTRVSPPVPASSSGGGGF